MKKLITTLILSAMAAPAMAGEFYVLDINEHIRSRNNDTIPLKRKMRQQHPGVNVRDADLLSVMMVAKTKQGRGSAELMVGQQYSQAQNVDGHPSDFFLKDEKSYDRVLFKNPKGNSNGRWQIKLRGNFQVKQIVVEISDSKVQETISYHDMHTNTRRGGIDTLYLKQKLNSESSIIPADYELDSVEVYGKSRAGQGTATLKVGQAMSVAKKLAKSERAFQSNIGYSKVILQNPKANSNGVWQIKLNGNIKIQKVILNLKKKST